MKKLLLLLWLLSPLLLFAQIGKTYHVTTQTLNLRSESSTSSEIIEKLKIHDNILMLNDTVKTGWCKVKHYKTEGYVSNKYLKKGKCVVSYYEVRTGAVCRDGTHSTATGRGACSHHGGVSYWKTTRKKSIKIINQ